MKHILRVSLVAALCCLASHHALAVVCGNTSLEGPRSKVADNCNGTCGEYDVGADLATDLGFGTPAADMISFQFYSPDNNPPATGTFDLGSAGNSNYATCAQCVLIYQDINTADQKIFFQTAGTITIDAATVPGVAADVGLAWSNVTLAEVTIAPVTYLSAPVVGGACLVADQVIFRNGFDG